MSVDGFFFQIHLLGRLKKLKYCNWSIGVSFSGYKIESPVLCAQNTNINSTDA